MRGVIHASHNVQIFTTVGLSIALQNVALVVWTGTSARCGRGTHRS